jgi:hypothetical protein
MKRDEFVFVLGYQGDTAIIDGHAKKLFKGASTGELLEKGLFKAAFCSALYAGTAEEKAQVLEAYNKASSDESGIRFSSFEDISRVVGVFEVPEDIVKTAIL